METKNQDSKNVESKISIQNFNLNIDDDKSDDDLERNGDEIYFDDEEEEGSGRTKPEVYEDLLSRFEDFD